MKEHRKFDKSRTLRQVVLLGFFVITIQNQALSEGLSRTPVLLELFTSEGCSSCPPADALLKALDETQPIEGVDIIVLSEHVDYWNSLGWKDPYSSAAFSERQQRYAARLRLASVYTPQLIVDGQSELVGSNTAKAKEVIEIRAKQEKEPLRIESIAANGQKIRVRISLEHWRSVRNGHATLFVAIASNRAQSQVSAGENSGRRLMHVAVVRSLESLGDVQIGAPLSRDIALPLNVSDRGSVRVVAFLQEGQSQSVVGIAQLRP